MKLEIGQFVRTKDGIIAKVDYIDDNTIFFDKDLYRTYGDSINFLEKDNLEKIVKASYNIIDILKVGDYVNGVEVINIDDEWITTSDIQVPILKSIANGMIKSVITHEQMEQMAYKVGE
jgi:hypothetical protein